MDRRTVIAVRVARRTLSFEFPSEVALHKYLKAHPGADESLHWVADSSQTSFHLEDEVRRQPKGPTIEVDTDLSHKEFQKALNAVMGYEGDEEEDLHEVTVEEVASLMGLSHFGDEVTVTLHTDPADDSFWLRAKGGPIHKMEIQLQDNRRMSFEYIELESDAPPGTGTEIFKRMVEEASDANYDSIDIHQAARGGPFVGYYVWPRLGCDTELNRWYKDKIKESVESEELPEDFLDYENVSDLMRTPEGRAWWKKHGDDIDLTFDISGGQYPSMDIFEAYLKEREERPKKVASSKDEKPKDKKPADKSKKSKGNPGIPISKDEDTALDKVWDAWHKKNLKKSPGKKD